MERMELRTTHEGADIIVVQQAIHLASLGKQSIHIVADDTDISHYCSNTTKLRISPATLS